MKRIEYIHLQILLSGKGNFSNTYTLPLMFLTQRCLQPINQINLVTKFGSPAMLRNFALVTKFSE
jgi:hypothetical protein